MKFCRPSFTPEELKKFYTKVVTDFRWKNRFRFRKKIFVTFFLFFVWYLNVLKHTHFFFFSFFNCNSHKKGYFLCFFFKLFHTKNNTELNPQTKRSSKNYTRFSFFLRLCMTLLYIQGFFVFLDFCSLFLIFVLLFCYDDFPTWKIKNYLNIVPICIYALMMEKINTTTISKISFE